MKSAQTTLAGIIANLPAAAAQHARTTTKYREFAHQTAEAIKESRFTQTSDAREHLGEFGEIEFPYQRMGSIDTLDLFGVDELIIFSFYARNRARYTRAADIGANLGLHSILMAKCGWNVKAYEPDPVHAALLKRNIAMNGLRNVNVVEAAVSDRPGTLEFVRVLGNTTSSHLAGAKSNAHGQLERFPVRVESIADIMPTVDFVKMDAEGQEKIIILGTTADHWKGTDMMVEVGSPENAQAIYGHLRQLGVRAFAQKLGWEEVSSVADMPTSYKDGSLFVTIRASMPWA